MMSSGIDTRHTASSNTTSEGLERFARRNINVLEERLPGPSAEPWTVSEIGMNPWTIQDWVEAGIIQPVGTHPEPGCDAQLYETTPGGWRALQAAPTHRSGPQAPCGHYGIHNPRGVDGLECLYEDCNVVFEKHEIETGGEA